MSERGSAETMKRSSQRGTAMTASVMRLRRDALSYLLGLGLLLAAALMVCGSLAAPAWGQGPDQPAAGSAAEGQTPEGPTAEGRSGERPAGKECISPFRPRIAPSHKQKNI